jgi:hypothetical protein
VIVLIQDVIVLIELALPALLLSGAAWLSLRLAPRAPPRLKFWIAMLGLAAWLVPWPLVSWPALFAGPPSIVRWLDEGVRSAAAPMQLASPLVGGGGSAVMPRFVWLCLLAPGLLWFALEYAAHVRTLRAWRRESRDGRELMPLLPPALALHAARIRLRVVPGSLQAAATGVFRPTIWIGAALSGEVLRTAVIHEACHVRSRDPLWLLFIQLLRRMYCWNPVVAVLARHAHLWLEAACDGRCADLLGPSDYRRTLARLVLSVQQRPHGAAALLGAPKQNLRRIELLERDWHIAWRERACIALCAAAAVCSTAVAGAHRDPRIGQWAEVGESAPDGEPILHRFEDLGGGFARFESDVMADGTAMQSADYRCDGRSYPVRGRFGEQSGWALSCRIVDSLTVEVTFAAAAAAAAADDDDGSARQLSMIDRVSRDGETYTSTVTTPRASDGSGGATSVREFWRLH